MLPTLPARRLEGRLRAAGDGVRAVELPRQHRRGDDRRRDGAHRVPRQGAHRLSRGDRRGVERRRRRQRGRRHDHDDDVDRRRRAARGARGLRRGGRRAGGLRHSGGAAAAALLADREARRSRRRRSTGCASASSPSSWSPRSSPTCSSTCASTRSSDRFPFIGAAVWVAILLDGAVAPPDWSCCPAPSRARSSCCRWCCARR